MRYSNLVKRFKNKIKYDGRNYKWFLRKYLPFWKYATFTSQINSFNPLKEELIDAMKKYLLEK